MKKIFTHSLTAIGALGFLTLSLQLVGCHSFPTATEQRFFNIETNYVPVTNAVIVTNPDGTKTTNLVETSKPIYLFTKGAGETQITQIGTEVGNLFGVGGIVGTALGALFGAWRWVRGNKAAQTADNLAQSIEMIREFVKSLPNGAVYDSELVNWLTQHQAEAGVLQSVIAILKNEVNNPEAKAAADQVIATIASLIKK